MKDLIDAPTCEFRNELISFVYGELTDGETQAFKSHLNICRHCNAELDSFGELRNAIGGWKYQALTGFSSPQEVAVVQHRKQKSATAALREFFDLSPLWMKGAVGLAAMLFCILAVLATGIHSQEPVSPGGPTARTYDQQQVDALIAKALAQQPREAQAEAPKSERDSSGEASASKTQSNAAAAPQLVRSRRPLSRAEREQLAADLRLASSRNDESFDLISDRIND